MASQGGCKLIHSWLLAGTCPKCGTPIVHGRPRANLAPRDIPERRWNTVALLAALDDPDPAVRHYVMWSVRHHGPKAVEAMPVLGKALADPDPAVREEAATVLHLRGARMFAAEAERLEDHVRQSPDDLAARGLLLGYYFLRQSYFEVERLSRQRHALWVIANAPGSEVAGCPLCYLDPHCDPEVYGEAKALWLRQAAANETNPTILGNAAEFFTVHDKAVCENLLRKAQALEPANPYWSHRLGELYQLQTQSAQHDGESGRGVAAKALAELERAWELATEERLRFDLLVDLAEAALRADEREKARAYAEEQLAKTRLPEFADAAGAAIHYGNLVLGHLALASGDVEGAKGHLVGAGRTPGSAPLCSFGPRMALAKELLDRGEREAVLHYLRLCSVFWQPDDQCLDQWIWTIEQGGVPDFGVHLFL